MQDDDKTIIAGAGAGSRQIGPYELLEPLGEGAMGIVYKGFDPSVKRYVALKTVRRDLLGADAERLLARVEVEAQAAGRLSHPHIVTVYGLFKHDGLPVIAMELVSGHTLESVLLRGGAIEHVKACQIAVELLEALEYAHRQCVVHRDIKPSNIMVLDGDAGIKVMDFGVAKIAQSNLTMVGEVMGTPNYMAPEQWQGEPVDARTDLFSAGVILYQTLTGEKPFAADSVNAIRNKALNVDPPPPSALMPRLPPAFDGLLRKALAKDPGQRFQSAAEFIRAIGAVSEAQPTVRAQTTQPTAGKTAGRRGVLVGATVLAVAGIGGAAGWFALRPAAPVVGYLKATSDPDGATLLLDGTRLLGLTPARLELAAGEHAITAKKTGYFDWEATIEIKPGVETPLDIVLNAAK